MQILLGLCLLIFATIARASPFISSDPYPGSPLPTHCGIYVDAAAKTEITITKDSTGTYCKWDLSGMTVGQHTIKATHIIKDPIWGNLESGVSNPLSVTRPAAPSAPAGLGIIP